ncbi:pseudouridine synthase, TruB family [Skeletonema marinoi]|uniref:tRNA pseudouridine(55) synthase n=1 Tax=Skeletonema marinoi TaxID=267567 RepID=A0AAD8Y1Q4_9STRA|nr:pseudouridine synthase, TruB family [Skeletonema marinoi]
MKRARPVAVAAAISDNNATNKRVMLAASNDLSTSSSLSSITDPSKTTSATTGNTESTPLYLAEGLIAIHKPLTWTCNDVVSYIRGILSRDAQSRGFEGKMRKRGKPVMKVGHGGTLDPLASGVLVLGIGKGTSKLQSYLEGDKQYTAMVELGYETTTLDAEGEIVKTMDWNHVTSIDSIRETVVPKFTGKIQQVPPLYSAIRVDGKRLYEIARGGDEKEVEDVEIPMRDVEVYKVEVENTLSESVIQSGVVDGKKYKEAVQEMEAAAAAAAAEKAAAAPPPAEDVQESNDEANNTAGKKKKKRRGNKNKGTKKKSFFDESTVPTVTVQCDSTTATTSFELPLFTLNVSCGGGTYIRSIVRDIGYEMDTVATMTGLVRTKQGPFLLEDALRKEDWNADNIYEAMTKIE